MNMEQFLGGFRGCAEVCRGAKTQIYAFGFSDLPNSIQNTPGTKFATASAGKVFVAVGILLLIERGRLSFDSRLGGIIDRDWKNIDPDITVLELLTHTSGIPDYCDESVVKNYEDLWRDFPNYKIRSNSDLLPLFIDKPMMYPRGSRFQYNNTGFVVLAMIIEKLAGLPFDEFLSENVFAPSGMSNTGYYELDRLPAKCASNYIYDRARDAYRTNIYGVDAKGTGAGGAFTTIGDIRRFWESLSSGRLLSSETVSDMFVNHSGGNDCYGLGVWLKKRGGIYTPYFQGSDPGVSFISSYDAGKRLLITLVSNYGDDVWTPHEKITAYFNGAAH